MQTSPMAPQQNQSLAPISSASGVQINSQLEQILNKLKNKVQNEVQQRIQNQSILQDYVQKVGHKITDKLSAQFEAQVSSLSNDVDSFESDLQMWERGMLDDLSNNRSNIYDFNQEINKSLQDMSRSVNEKYKLAKEFQDKVRQQMDDLEHTVY